MKSLTTLFGLLLLYFTSLAQEVHERMHINGGSELWTNFMKEMFLYPEFNDGTIRYHNGMTFARKVNYNRILETIQFIDEKGDTLAIADEAAVKDIIVKNDTFIYNPECLEVINANNTLQLLKHEKMRIADIRRKGLYGIPNTSSAMESINMVYTWMNSYQVDVNELLLLSKTINYYVKKADGEKVSASRKNILAMFPKRRDDLKKYIDEKKINFNKEADLSQLVSYIGTASQ